MLSFELLKSLIFLSLGSHLPDEEQLEYPVVKRWIIINETCAALEF